MFENYFTSRAKVQNSLHRSLDDYLPEVTEDARTRITIFCSTLTIGTFLFLGVSSLLSIPEVEGPPGGMALAMSAAYADKEELCINQWDQKSPSGYSFLCSKEFDKGRRPGGKLITSKLPSADDTINARYASMNMAHQVFQANAGAVSMPTDAPNTVDQVTKQMAADIETFRFQQQMASKPDVIPVADNVNLSENKVTALDALPRKRTMGSSINTKKRQACKKRSYWSEKHGECRRRR